MKRFNLLFDSWIPIKTRQGGNRPLIKAYEIVQKDIIGLDAPRADFNAALMQFLIGLLQTVLAPKNPKEWRTLFNQPPSEDELKRKFKEKDIEDAFYLDGDGYRFMQDISIKDQGNMAGVIKLIPGIVGENTVKKNKDFFLKSSQLSRVSVSNLVTGLYLYHNYCLSEKGGKFGQHHGSFRKRNTLTVFIIKEAGSLWENLWLNIIQNNKYRALISSDLIESNFVWMHDFPNEKKQNDNNMTIKDIYWSMPRRVWVDFTELKKGICDLTSKETEVIENIFIKENGIEYRTELTRHPLIPYSKDDKGVHPIKINGEGITYGDWLALVGGDTASENLLEHMNRNLDGSFKILVCGYLNHSREAKTLCWFQNKMPIYGTGLEKDVQKAIENEIDRYIQASNKIGNSRGGYLTTAIKSAWFGESKEKNKDKKKAFNNERGTEIAKSFWTNTENKFYELIKKMYDNSHDLTDEERFKLKRDWYRHIKDEATKLFNLWAFKSSIQTNPRRIAEAHNKLLINLNSKSLKQDILGLPKED